VEHAHHQMAVQTHGRLAHNPCRLTYNPFCFNCFTHGNPSPSSYGEARAGPHSAPYTPFRLREVENRHHGLRN
jgi:hypothetical protein